MGHWSYINGQIISKKLSIKKIIRHVLDKEDFLDSYKSDNQFHVSLEEIDINTIKYVEEIINQSKSVDPNCKIEINVQTKFLR